MAQCLQPYDEFVKSTFSPHIAVICSDDCDVVCAKNNLTLVELLQPFSRLNAEISVRDPSGYAYTVSNLKLAIKDTITPPPQATLAKKVLSEVVAKTRLPPNADRETLSVGDYQFEICRATPWYDAFREAFLGCQWPIDTEFLRHFLACVFVVSSGVDDPMATFDRLTADQHKAQTMMPPRPYPKWFSSNTYKYYVLLHDVSDGAQGRAESVYQSMKNAYGATNCHLLQINSRPASSVERFLVEEGNNFPDPWALFLSKNVSSASARTSPLNGVVTVAEPDSKADSSSLSRSVCGGSDLDLAGLPSRVTEQANTVVDVAVDVLESDADDGMAVVGAVVDHPLSNSNGAQPVEDDDRIAGSGFGSFSCDPTFLGDGEESFRRSSSFFSSQGVEASTSNVPHGLCLTVSDQDRIKIFIHEFCVRGLVPWVERTMRNLNEQVASRQGLLGRFQGTRKWGLFGNRSSNGPNSSNPLRQTGLLQCPYAPEGPELQLRRLADISFMFQNYELAFKHYYTAKKDFQTDQAWPFYAGALEMAAVSHFMQHQSNHNGGSRQPYPTRYMEQAITTYDSTCKMPGLATRAVMISTEALKCQRYYTDAAMQFIKMTSEDSDLRSAVLLEQAAHCFLAMKTPMVRKYAFHMILAGHRFSKASQRQHALRCYEAAMSVYCGRGWSPAEDHINFTIGRQSFNLKNLDDAASAFKKLLTERSVQTPHQQTAFLKEYLYVMKQLLLPSGSDSAIELHLPTIEQNETKVMLGCPSTQAYLSPQSRDGDEAERASAAVLFGNASSVDFSELTSTKEEGREWARLEEALVRNAAGNGKLPPNMMLGFKPQVRLLSRNTSNNSSPLTAVDEPIAFQIKASNPLKVPLVLCDIRLRWEFTLAPDADDAPSSIDVEAETLPEFILPAGTIQAVVLKLVPRRRGYLTVTGIDYSLGSTSQSQIAAAVSAAGSSALTPTGSSSPSSFKRGYASMAINGFQRLYCRGPRLNNTKAEKKSLVYGEDKRLSLEVVCRQPCLGLKFHASSSNSNSSDAVEPPFPETLLGGQLHFCVAELKNKGAVDLLNLTVVSNLPDVVAFGERLVSSKAEADQLRHHSELDWRRLFSQSSNDSPCLKLHSPGESLRPSESCFVPVWVRGPDKPGLHSFKIMFYYEAPAEWRHPRLPYRVLYHKSILVSRPSLQFVAVASRGNFAENQAEIGSSESTTSGGVVALDLEMHNAANGQRRVPDDAVDAAVEFQLLQISAFSRRLRLLDCVRGEASGRGTFNAAENLLLTLSGDKSADVESSTGSSVVVSGDEIDATCFPFARFSLWRQRIDSVNADHRGINELLPKNAAFIEREANLRGVAEARTIDSVITVLWKAAILDAMGNCSSVMGQHHVTLDSLDDLVRFRPCGGSDTTHLSVKPPIVFPPVIHHSRRKQSPPEIDTLKPGSLNQLLAVALSFPSHRVVHDFAAVRFCKARILISIINLSDCDVGFVVETGGHAQSASSEATGGIGASTANRNTSLSWSPFSWVGPMVRQRRLTPGTEAKIELIACFDRVGLYNLSSLTVRAAPMWMIEEEGFKSQEPFNQASCLVLQKCKSVRTIVVSST